MFNKTYHARARRGGMVSSGEVLEDLAVRAAERRRAKKRSAKLQGLQLELFPSEPPPVTPPDPDRPLADLFLEACV